MTRMQPYFNPGPDDATVAPAIYLGGVATQGMCAGRRGGRRLHHPSHQLQSPLPGNHLPARSGRRSGPCRPLPRGRLLRAGHRHPDHHRVVSGGPGKERERQRHLLAFLYSTPAYRPTLELYGWAELGPRLRAMIRSERWDDLAGILSDEVLDTLVPSGTFAELPDLLKARFGTLGQAIVASPPGDSADDGEFGEVIRALQAI